MPAMLPSSTAGAARKVVVITTYEEVPRHRGPGASTSTGATTRAKTRAPPTTHQEAVGGYNRRAMLLAYAQQLRRRRCGQIRSGAAASRVLGWGEWKKAASPGAGSSNGAAAVGTAVATGRRRRSWCSRFRLCVRLWIRTFLRRVRMIRENASCRRGERRSDGRAMQERVRMQCSRVCRRLIGHRCCAQFC